MDVQPGQKQQPEQFREGKVARAIESQTARLPSDVFLWAASGVAIASLITQLIPGRMGVFGRSERPSHLSLFLGQWVPTLLIFGLYNKLVKTTGGSDRATVRESKFAH